MTRDEFEAVIWEDASRLTQRNPKAVRTAAMDRILAAADEYATYTGGITAERRLVLASLRKAGTP